MFQVSLIEPTARPHTQCPSTFHEPISVSLDFLCMSSISATSSRTLQFVLMHMLRNAVEETIHFLLIIFLVIGMFVSIVKAIRKVVPQRVALGRFYFSIHSNFILQFKNLKKLRQTNTKKRLPITYFQVYSLFLIQLRIYLLSNRALKESYFKLAPPTSAPSISGQALYSLTLFGLTLPPQRIRILEAATFPKRTFRRSRI